MHGSLTGACRCCGACEAAQQVPRDGKRICLLLLLLLLDTLQHPVWGHCAQACTARWVEQMAGWA